MKKIILGFSLASFSFATYAAQSIPIPDIAPVAQGQQVVINIPQQRLFLYQDGKLKKVYPVGVGKAMSQTNLGAHKIGAKAFNPTWHIPKSIQRERGDGVKTVPPGPRNPLGPVFVRLGNPKLGLGIHGTSNPKSVPGVVSHGCVRMKSPDALEFAKTIHTGAEAFVSYELAALNEDSAGNLWLAAFKDPYNKKNLRTNKLKQAIIAWADVHNREISAASIDKIVRARSGQPVCLTCGKGKAKIQGDFKSIAWNSGSHELTMPVGGMSVRPDVQDEILPEGTEIEVDAAAELDKFQGSSVFDDAVNVASNQNQALFATASNPPAATITQERIENETPLKSINALF
ncbi:L,D-transpeptidase [Neisseriaceae bacterium B1]